MGQYYYLRISLLVIAIMLCTALRRNMVSCNTENNPDHVRSSKHERIQKLLRRINKTPILTISSPDGDIIDCVHRRKQLAFDHPLLKNHKIQRFPSERPSRSKGGRGREVVGRPDKLINGWQTQLWHQNGTICPKGTVPVRRITVDDLLRAPSLDLFGKKRHRNNFTSPVVVGNDLSSAPVHQHAIVDLTVTPASSSQGLYGTKATINLQEPYIEQSANEFSLAQLWITSGSYQGSDLATVEAGWQVYPSIYGDSQPRLFVYWTTDAYQYTGCYNLKCSGFVQTSSQIAVGGAISQVSSQEMTLVVYKDQKQGNWWLDFNGNPVGYWPAELYTNSQLSQYATTVQWGGEVCYYTGGQHTATQMGSGQFAEEGYGKASYFRGLEVVDSTNTLQSSQLGQGRQLAEAPTCYDVKNYYDAANSRGWGYYFFYGGPGRNPNCP